VNSNVNVDSAGYLQLANSLLGLGLGIAFISLGSDAEGYRVGLGLFAFAVFTAVVGVGLLRRRPWARWLMLGPGFIGPLTAVVGLGIFALGAFVGALALNSARGWFFGWSAHSDSWGIWIWLLAVSMIVSGIVNFRLFGYLLNERGRAEFDSQEKGPVGATLLSLAIAALAVFVAVTGTVRIPRERVPEVLRSPSMRSFDANIEAGILEALPRAASKVVFSADNRRIIILPETSSLELVVIDLDSGVARRPELKSPPMFRDTAQFWRVMAPDASSFLMGDQWTSLESGVATDVRDLLPTNAEPLGFHASNRLLIRNRQTDALQLLDLQARRVVYSVPANIGPYDFPGMLDSKYNDPPVGWSRARDRFAWITVDGGLSTLDMDSGDVRTTPCANCQTGRRLRFADDEGGAMLVVPDNSLAYEWSAQLVPAQGEIAETTGLHGELVFFSGADHLPWVLLSNSGKRSLVFRDFVSGANWEADHGGERLETVTANHDLLIKESGRDGPDRYWLAHLEPPPGHRQLVLEEIGLTLPNSYFRAPSPDGRFLAFASLDGQLEIIDVRSIRDGAFDSHTLDVRTGTRLEAKRKIPVKERRTLEWRLPGTVKRETTRPANEAFPGDESSDAIL
jgi:hypothetical protein